MLNEEVRKIIARVGLRYAYEYLSAVDTADVKKVIKAIVERVFDKEVRYVKASRDEAFDAYLYFLNKYYSISQVRLSAMFGMNRSDVFAKVRKISGIMDSERMRGTLLGRQLVDIDGRIQSTITRINNEKQERLCQVKQMQ